MLHINRIQTRDYAWRISRDHLFQPGEPADRNEAGTCGPGSAPDDLLTAVEWLGARHTTDRGICVAEFRMYDDDGILYYSGWLAYRPEAEGEEHVITGPLVDFGAPNAGCTAIEYPGHPDWAVG